MTALLMLLAALMMPGIGPADANCDEQRKREATLAAMGWVAHERPLTQRGRGGAEWLVKSINNPRTKMALEQGDAQCGTRVVPMWERVAALAQDELTRLDTLAPKRPATR